MEPAELRDVSNLQNWLNSNGCIAREEMQYLSHKHDLTGLGSFSVDRAVSRLQGPIEDLIEWLSRKMPNLIKLVCYLLPERDESH
jgi:hypothetical protein